MRYSALVYLAAMAGCAASGQEPARPVAFEVASVKRAAPPAETGGPRSTGGAPPTAEDARRINYSNVTLKGVLCRAYDLPPDRIVAPDWLGMERYDIFATVPKDAPAGQIPLMLQRLLAERFQMSVHWAEKEAAGYALVVGKTGPKLTNSSVEGLAGRSAGMTISRSGHLAWTGTTLAGFAAALSHFLDRPVADRTGVQGLFDITLDASPDSLPGLHAGTPDEAAAPLPSIFTAIRGLGLELTPRQDTVRQLVVDSARKIPTPN